MDYVQPITSTKKIAQIKTILKANEDYRDLLLFTVGINAALRISDLLSLTVGDFLHNGELSDFSIREQKTGKTKEVVITDGIREAWQLYARAYPNALECPTNAVFFNTRSKDYSKPISRQNAHLLVKKWTDSVGLKSDDYGCHSLRKTWGFQARMAGVDLGIIMEMLNHSSIANTKRYLGLTQQELSEVVRKLNL